MPGKLKRNTTGKIIALVSPCWVFEFSPDHVADCMHVTQNLFWKAIPAKTGPHQHTTPAPPNSLDRAPQWATIFATSARPSSAQPVTEGMETRATQ